MKLHLTIERDGAILKTLELDQGEHGIGRTDDNAIVLDDKAVSSHHALLRVGDKEVELIDQGSLNGIFVNGEKVGKSVFNRELTADICGFCLRARVVAPKRRSKTVSFSHINPRTAILVATAALTLFALAATWFPGKAALLAMREREALRRGALLVRSLAEQNSLPLRAKLLDQVRTTPVEAEDGVHRAVVADPFGKILAPPKDLGKALEYPETPRAAKEPGISLWAGPKDTSVLAYPIRDDQGLLGLALIVFSPDQALPPLAPTGVVLLWALAAFALWAVTARVILRLTLHPVRILAEDIGVALKSGAKELNFSPASPEFSDLKRAVERLLVLVPTGEPDCNASAPPPRRDILPDRKEPTTPSASPQGTDPRGPSTLSSPLPPLPPLPSGPGEQAGDAVWCLLELAGYRLTGWSPSFAVHLVSPDMTPPVHLLSALADPSMLAAVASVVDDPAAEAARPVENQALTAVKEPGPEPGTVRVRITENA
ncbi:MAG: FHA domain-containing protein [Solidesulfovibrio sp.]